MKSRFTVKDARSSFFARASTLGEIPVAESQPVAGAVRPSTGTSQGVHLNESPGDLVYQVFTNQGTIGRNQGTIGRNQGTIGRDQGTIGRNQSSIGNLTGSAGNTIGSFGVSSCTKGSDGTGEEYQVDTDDVFDAVDGRSLAGTFTGVYMPTCEAMWGALIFIRFGIITGETGLILALGMVLGSAMIVSLTAASISALGTNGAMSPDGPNGVYFLLTRNLGPSIGGSVSMIYCLGATVMSTVEIIGFTEGIAAVIYMESGTSLTPSVYTDQVMFGIIGLVIVAVTLFAGETPVHYLGLSILAVVLAAYFVAFLGLFASIGGWQTGPVYIPEYNTTSAGVVTGLDAETMVVNLWPEFSPGFQWGTALAYIFPCFLGIFMGANNANGLKNPSRSIPKGAFSAILTSLALYTLIFCLLSAVAERELLKNMLLLFCYMGWPTKYISICGLLVVGIGAAIQLLQTAPKVMASLATDGIIPVLKWIGLHKRTSSGFPARATVACLLICLPFVFATNLDIVATIVTMMFLLSYATVNFTCFLLSVLKSPSWRPGFRWYHPYFTALAGTVCCIALMFALNWLAALVSILLTIVLAFYIEYQVNTEIWGTGLKSMQLHFATRALISMEQQEVIGKYIQMLRSVEISKNRASTTDYVEESGEDENVLSDLDDDNSKPLNRVETIIGQLNGLGNFLSRSLHEIPDDFITHKPRAWVPRFLLLVQMDGDNDDITSFETTLLSFLYMLAKGSAKDIFIMVGNVIKRDYGLHTQERFLSAMRRKVLLQGAMQKAKIDGLAEVVVAKDIEVGANILIQTAGVGSLRPNTIIAGWPRQRTQKQASYVVSLVSLTRASSRACIFLKHGSSFPRPEDKVMGTIDLWWILQEGGMLLLVAFLLTQHKSWKGCKLRLFTVAELTANSLYIESQLTSFLRELRIKAEVKVIEIDTAQIIPFTNGMTISRHQSQAAAKLLKKDGSKLFPTTVDQLAGVVDHKYALNNSPHKTKSTLDLPELAVSGASTSSCLHPSSDMDTCNQASSFSQSHSDTHNTHAKVKRSGKKRVTVNSRERKHGIWQGLGESLDTILKGTGISSAHNNPKGVNNELVSEGFLLGGDDRYTDDETTEVNDLPKHERQGDTVRLRNSVSSRDSFVEVDIDGNDTNISTQDLTSIEADTNMQTNMHASTLKDKQANSYASKSQVQNESESMTNGLARHECTSVEDKTHKQDQSEHVENTKNHLVPPACTPVRLDHVSKSNTAGVSENARGSVGTDEGANASAGAEALFAAPGLKEVMKKHSSRARLVIMNLPVPTDDSANNPSAYLDLVNDLTEDLSDVVLVNGLSDGTQVISVYQT